MKENAAGSYDLKKHLDENVSNLAGVSKQEAVVEIPLDRIVPNRFQPRKVFAESDLKELAASIQEHGVLQPILVRETQDTSSPAQFEIIAGERRFRASKLAGKTSIPAIIKNIDDARLNSIALIENVHRKDLNVVEKTAAILSLTRIDGMDIYKQTALGEKAIEKYLRIGTVFYSEPAFKELFDKSHALEFTTAYELTKFIEKVRRLKKSDNKAFYRIIKRLTKIGLGKEALVYLSGKFKEGNGKGGNDTPATIQYDENEREAILKIRLNRTQPLPVEDRVKIENAIQGFMALLPKEDKE